MKTILVLCEQDVHFRRAFVTMLISECSRLDEQRDSAAKNFALSEEREFRDRYLRVVGAQAQLQYMIDTFDIGHIISEGVKDNDK